MKEGKVVEYDGFIGEINSNGETYLFLKDDLNSEIKENDNVVFRGENIKDINRAFFVNTKENYKILSMKGNNNER